MKLKLFSFLFIIVLLTSFTTQASISNDNIIKSFQHKNTVIGVSVKNAKTGKEIYSYNANKPLNPASTMKVITSIVALNKLGGSYKYTTKITTDRVDNNTAYNLYIKGTGDPSIVEERLWRMAKDLKVRGINKIEGNIIIDNSFFDSFDFTGKEDNNARAYNAKLSPFAVNFNSFAVVAKNYGNKLEVHIDPPTNHFVLTSKIKGKGSHISIDREYYKGQEHVAAAGGVSSEKIKYANASDPVQYAGTTLAWVLSQLGIEFNGKIRPGKAGGNTILVSDKSKPLSLILRDLNKYSNNFTAEMVLKTLAAKELGVPGSTEKGITLSKGFVQSLGINSNEYSIYNGSGLSRNNRLSPNTLTSALVYAYQKGRIRSDFIATLSIAGTDGTLRSRLNTSALKGNVKAKTGTLNDVAALSGYLETKSHIPLAFTILVNGPAAGAGGYFGLQEKLLLNLYNE